MSRLPLGFALGLLLVAATAAAQPVDDATRGAARKLGNDAVAAYQAGDFATAHDKFDRAYRVLKVPSLGLWSARTFVKLGKLVEANERYLEVTRLVPEGGDIAVQTQARLDAQKELDALAPRVPSIVVVVQGARPEEVAVSIDGVPLASALIGESRPVNPGAHLVLGKSSSGEAKVEVDAVEGKQVTATLVFESAGDVAQAPSTASGDTGGSPPSRGSTLRTAGWITLGVGAAGLVTGAVTGALAASKHSSLEDDPRCRGGECLRSASDDVDSLDTFRTVSTVGFIAGGVLAAAGVTLLLTAPKQESEVALRLGPGSVRLVGSF